MITLSQDDLKWAAEVGHKRHTDAVKRNLKSKNMSKRSDLSIHIQGARGELAFAKYLGITWKPTINTFHAPDVDGSQVRTRSEDWHDLIVRTTDPPDEPFVLVIETGNQYDIRGWIWGDDARKEDYWKDPNGRGYAWFVPQKHLLPMETYWWREQ